MEFSDIFWSLSPGSIVFGRFYYTWKRMQLYSWYFVCILVCIQVQVRNIYTSLLVRLEAGCILGYVAWIVRFESLVCFKAASSDTRFVASARATRTYPCSLLILSVCTSLNLYMCH